MREDDKKPICKILTVDDQMGIDSFFYEFFTVRNYEVFNALSGKEAIKIVQKERPRIILLDINMRGMDGIETLKKIREIDKECAIIMVTGVKDD
ncbi:MAG: response regulator, partial [Candidatus Omnitrophica bacterium]|nr:response regulator [Candidatus Omnitrophota bacterium]